MFYYLISRDGTGTDLTRIPATQDWMDIKHPGTREKLLNSLAATSENFAILPLGDGSTGETSGVETLQTHCSWITLDQASKEYTGEQIQAPLAIYDLDEFAFTDLCSLKFFGPKIYQTLQFTKTGADNEENFRIFFEKHIAKNSTSEGDNSSSDALHPVKRDALYVYFSYTTKNYSAHAAVANLSSQVVISNGKKFNYKSGYIFDDTDLLHILAFQSFNWGREIRWVEPVPLVEGAKKYSPRKPVDLQRLLTLKMEEDAKKKMKKTNIREESPDQKSRKKRRL